MPPPTTSTSAGDSAAESAGTAAVGDVLLGLFRLFGLLGRMWLLLLPSPE
jgi:hypothetical protein